MMILVYLTKSILVINTKIVPMESAMSTMLRWSPTRQFHFHRDADDMLVRFFGGPTDEAAQRPSWLPAAEGRSEDGTYVIQIALPGVDPQKVEGSSLHNLPPVTRQPQPDPAP